MKGCKISSFPPFSSPCLILLIISSLVLLCVTQSRHKTSASREAVFINISIYCGLKGHKQRILLSSWTNSLIQRGSERVSSTYNQTSVSQIVQGRQIGAHNKRSSVIFKSTEFRQERRSAGQKVYLTGNMHTEWILLPCFSFALCIDFFGPI